MIGWMRVMSQSTQIGSYCRLPPPLAPLAINICIHRAQAEFCNLASSFPYTYMPRTYAWPIQQLSLAVAVTSYHG